MKKKLYLHDFKTELGQFNLASTEKGLAIINFTSPTKFRSRVKKQFGDHEIVSGGAINKRAEKEIKMYLAGQLKKFSIPLDPGGTDFQKEALKKVAEIPYGRTKTYGEIAGKLGKSGAARAVGSANARNPLPIIIPCHRVLAVNGLGGYEGGLKYKKFLLSLEKQTP